MSEITLSPVSLYWVDHCNGWVKFQFYDKLDLYLYDKKSILS